MKVREETEMTKKNIAKIICALAAAAVVSLASCSSELTDLQNLKEKAGTYTITYSANTTDTVTGSMQTQTVTRGVATALTANTFVRSGYVFAGWMTAADGTDAVYTDAQEVTDIAAAGAEITLYALWSNTLYSVAFKANDTHATGTMANQTIYTKVKTALTANAFTYTGYVFKGWATSTGGMAAYADGASVTDLADANKSITLYAVWSVSNVSSPADVKGAAALPVIKARITDHLYLASSAAGTSGYIACWETSGASTYQWWTSSDGTNWSEVSGKTSSYLQFTAASNTVVYYCMSATSSDGTSTAYSNVCTVECGTEKTNKIGQIYYTDGTVSSSYESGRTPAGIVSDVKPDGSVKTIVALEQNSGAWAPSGTTGYNTTFATSLSDGKGNWAVIQAADPEGSKTATNYPAFSYCNAYTGGGYDAGTWYLPSRDELSTISFHKTAINTGLKTLSDNGCTATQLGTGWYWSSSQYSSVYYVAWLVSFVDGRQGNDYKDSNLNVRSVAGF